MFVIGTAVCCCLCTELWAQLSVVYMLYLVLCLCLIVPTVEDCVVYQLCMFIMLKCRWKALDISELQNARDMSG